jgi:4-hydroxybenzoate polyprenyltransferase
MRLDRPVGWWLLLLPSWWAITLAGNGIQNLTLWDWYMLLLFFVGAIIMRGAGCVINDLFDRDLDAKVERTRARPLAAGTVTPIQAGLFLFVLLFLGLIILVQTSAITIWIGFLAMVFVVAYPYMKRITWWPQAFLALLSISRADGLGGVTYSLDWQAFVMYVGAFFWTLGYDTIYAHSRPRR